MHFFLNYKKMFAFKAGNIPSLSADQTGVSVKGSLLYLAQTHRK